LDGGISPLESPSIGLSCPLKRAAGVYTLCKANTDEKTLLTGLAKESRHPTCTGSSSHGTQGCRVPGPTSAYANKIIWSTSISISRNLVRDDPQQPLWWRSGNTVTQLSAGGRLSEDSQMTMLQRYSPQGHRHPSLAAIPVTRDNASEAEESTGGCRPWTGLALRKRWSWQPQVKNRLWEMLLWRKLKISQSAVP